MNNRDIQERNEGALEIENTLKSYAKNQGLIIERLEWDYGRKLVEIPLHTLSVHANGKIQKAELPDEWLVDYPGRAGTENTNRVLMEIIYRLC